MIIVKAMITSIEPWLYLTLRCITPNTTQVIQQTPSRFQEPHTLLLNDLKMNTPFPPIQQSYVTMFTDDEDNVDDNISVIV